MNASSEKKVFVVTGSSSGIGFGIAKAALEQGHQVGITPKDEIARSLDSAAAGIPA